MGFDLLITGGLVVDGTGAPPREADVGITNGRIAAVGRLSDPASRTIDAHGHVVTPGFIDHHTHYDGQVTFDPLCSFSSYNGVTTVVSGNCSLTLAPVRPGDEAALAGMLSKVEAIPYDVLMNGVTWGWSTFGEYLGSLDNRLGINYGALVGHSAVRRWVMGDESQDREATGDEIEAVQTAVRESMEAGALGVSFDRNPRHVGMDGKLLPANVASLDELYAIASTLKSLDTGVIQVGDPMNQELSDEICTRMSEASGRPVTYLSIVQSTLLPEQWREHLAHLADVASRGVAQIYPQINPRPGLPILPDGQRGVLQLHAHLETHHEQHERGAHRRIRRRIPQAAARARGRRAAERYGPRLLRTLGSCRHRQARAREEQGARRQDGYGTRRDAQRYAARRIPRPRGGGGDENVVRAQSAEQRRRRDGRHPQRPAHASSASPTPAHTSSARAATATRCT